MTPLGTRLFRKLADSGEYPPSVLRELEKENSEELNLDLILCLLKYIANQPPGAVLVFMPGWDQISKLHKMIQEDCFFSASKTQFQFFVVFYERFKSVV